MRRGKDERSKRGVQRRAVMKTRGKGIYWILTVLLAVVPALQGCRTGSDTGMGKHGMVGLEHVALNVEDPVAMAEVHRIYGNRDDLVLAEDGMSAVEGADALAIVTEWPEFRSPDFPAIKRKLNHPRLFDGRNMFDPKVVTAAGLTYFSIGRQPTG